METEHVMNSSRDLSANLSPFHVHHSKQGFYMGYPNKIG